MDLRISRSWHLWNGGVGLNGYVLLMFEFRTWDGILLAHSKAWEGKYPVLSRLEALNCMAWLQKKFFGHKRSFYVDDIDLFPDQEILGWRDRR